MILLPSIQIRHSLNFNLKFSTNMLFQTFDLDVRFEWKVLYIVWLAGCYPTRKWIGYGFSVWQRPTVFLLYFFLGGLLSITFRDLITDAKKKMPRAALFRHLQRCLVVVLLPAATSVIIISNRNWEISCTNFALVKLVLLRIGYLFSFCHNESSWVSQTNTGFTMLILSIALENDTCF